MWYLMIELIIATNWGVSDHKDLELRTITWMTLLPRMLHLPHSPLSVSSNSVALGLNPLDETGSRDSKIQDGETYFRLVQPSLIYHLPLTSHSSCTKYSITPPSFDQVFKIWSRVKERSSVYTINTALTKLRLSVIGILIPTAI